MDRRNFLQTLIGGALGAQLDPEKLLWVPGAKRIFVPRRIRVPAPYRVAHFYDWGSGRWLTRVEALIGPPENRSHLVVYDKGPVALDAIREKYEAEHPGLTPEFTLVIP